MTSTTLEKRRRRSTDQLMIMTRRELSIDQDLSRLRKFCPIRRLFFAFAIRTVTFFITIAPIRSEPDGRFSRALWNRRSKTRGRCAIAHTNFPSNVRFGSEAAIPPRLGQCPLCANSGHSARARQAPAQCLSGSLYRSMLGARAKKEEPGTLSGEDPSNLKRFEAPSGPVMALQAIADEMWVGTDGRGVF